jgi:hypothetical protein
MFEDVISVDFECFYSPKLKYSVSAKGPALIAEEYVRHELFECYLISVAGENGCWAGHPNDFNWSCLEGKVLISHNRYFDNTVYNELVRREWAPKVNYKEWHCTANLTSYLCNRRALDQAIEHLFKVKVQKDYRDVMKDVHFKDLPKDKQDYVVKAGLVDAVWCRRIWTEHSHKWPEWERRLSNLTIDEGMRGVQIDTERLNNYIIQCHEMRLNAERAIPWIAGSEDEDEDYDWEDFASDKKRKPTSTKCIAQQCRLKGIPCAPVKSKDEEAYEEWETTYAPKHPWILAVGHWRVINKMYTTLLTMKRRVRSDGTMPFALKYFGAHTGRWAGDAKINLQNMRKWPMLCKQDGTLEDNQDVVEKATNDYKDTGKWADWVKYSVDFRSLFRARPGTKMIASDLSQIEPRVLAWLGNNMEMLKKIAEGMSVYEAFARTNMNYVGDKMDKRSGFYKLIKIQVLQLGYQAGWAKFIVTAFKEYGVDLTKDDPEWEEVIDPISGKLSRVSGYGKNAREIVKKFREQSPCITKLWEKMDLDFKRSVGDDYVVTLPSGRKMRYEHVKITTRIVKDPETGKAKKKTEFTADVAGKRRPFYGGKLVENITQAIARDVFAYLILKLADAGHINLFSCHDEAVLEVKPEVQAKDIEHIMSECPPWLKGAPIAAEASELDHYCK